MLTEKWEKVPQKAGMILGKNLRYVDEWWTQVNDLERKKKVLRNSILRLKPRNEEFDYRKKDGDMLENDKWLTKHVWKFYTHNTQSHNKLTSHHEKPVKLIWKSLKPKFSIFRLVET